MVHKNTMDDMIPPEKRTIRRVPLGTTARPRQNNSGSPEMPPDDARVPKAPVPPDREPPQTSFQNRDPKKKRWLYIALVAVGILIIVILLFSLFSRAILNVELRQEQTTVDGTFVAGAIEAFDVLPYEVFTITRSDQEQVVATGERYVEAKSSGTIVVFNDFDEQEQLLVANTRFETPEGLVYRIQEPITVPGQRTNEDGSVVPGSIEARVVADEAGPTYNIGLSDFTLPGLKESGDEARFAAFFARSKTPMTGGITGVQKTIDTQEAERARETIDARLTEELHTALRTELPENFVSYQDVLFITFTNLPQETADEEDAVILQREATLHALVFDINELARFIATNTIAAYSGENVTLADALSLSFRMLEKEAFIPGTSETFEFTLKGQADIIWELDEERLREDLTGKSKQEVSMVMSAYPAVREADVALYPFWRQSFPENTKKIHIKYDSK